jgi:uncharacterized protein YjbI with pentapeptide repeats
MDVWVWMGPTMMTSNTEYAKQEHEDRHSALVMEHHRSQRNVLFFGMFCFLTVLLPDSALIVSDRSIHIPGFNVPVSLYHFIPIASAILIALNIHKYSLQCQRLESARSRPLVDATLFHLSPWPAWILGKFISGIVPITLGVMTHKARVDWLLGGALLSATALVTMWSVGHGLERYLLATKPSLSRIKRFLRVPAYAVTICLILFQSVIIFSADSDTRIPEVVQSARDNEKAQGSAPAKSTIAALLGLVLAIPNAYEALLKESIVRRPNLAFADLSGASLPRAYLRGANLRHANLQGARLPRADLRDADLRKANLEGAHLYDADLERAVLSWADLKGASLYRADFKDAKLKGADLQGANLSRANLAGAKLQLADLRGTRLKSACLLRADLEKAKLDGADLEGAYLLRADLDKAKLEGDLECVNAQPQNVGPYKGHPVRAKLPCCVYRLMARKGDFGSISTGSPVYTNGRKVGHVISIEYHDDNSANRSHFTILTQNKISDKSKFYVAFAKRDNVPEDGIAFDKPFPPHGFAEQYHPFTLYDNRTDARGPTVIYKVHPHTSVHGLEVGAPVRFSGIEVGDVQWIGRNPEKDDTFQVQIMIRLMTRLGQGGAIDWQNIVCRGLRAHLMPITFMTPQQLFVDLAPRNARDFRTTEVELSDTPAAEVEPIADCGSASTPGIQARDRAPSQGNREQS